MAMPREDQASGGGILLGQGIELSATRGFMAE
jgi:hypothetical protein